MTEEIEERPYEETEKMAIHGPRKQTQNETHPVRTLILNYRTLRKCTSTVNVFCSMVFSVLALEI